MSRKKIEKEPIHEVTSNVPLGDMEKNVIKQLESQYPGMKVEQVSIKEITQEHDMNKIVAAMNQSIFRPVPKEINEKHRLQYKLSRFQMIHNGVKNGIIHPLLRFIAKRLGKFIVNNIDDIPPKWFNTHHRIFYWAWEQGLEDMWCYTYMPKYQEKYGSKENFLNTFVKDKTNFSNHHRMLLVKIWMTEIMEDTIDREWLNFFMLRMYWAMNDYYKGNVPTIPEHPTYSTAKEFNPDFHMQNMDRPVWYPPKKLPEESIK